MMRFASAMVLMAIIPVLANPVRASVLCKTRKGKLVVREACKPKELRIDAQQSEALGLQGPPGPPGPPGPSGPPGLVVRDANDQKVGVVAGVFFLFPGTGSFTVMRQMTLPDVSTPEWVAFDVDSGGFARAVDSQFFYRNPDCAGQRYTQFSCLGDTCDRAPLTRYLHPESDGRTAYYARASERETHQYYYVTLLGGVGPQDLEKLAASCAHTFGTIPGVVVGQPHPCFNGGTCLDCCLPFFTCPPLGVCQVATAEAAPAHDIDLQSLGLTPPFRVVE